MFEKAKYINGLEMKFQVCSSIFQGIIAIYVE